MHGATIRKSTYFYEAQLATFILLIFQSNFHFLDLILSDNFCCKLRLCAIQFGADIVMFKLQICSHV